MVKFDSLVDWMNIWENYFLFFENLHFLGPWDPFFPKTLVQPREVKNGPIMLKFCTIVH